MNSRILLVGSEVLANKFYLTDIVRTVLVLCARVPHALACACACVSVAHQQQLYGSQK